MTWTVLVVEDDPIVLEFVQAILMRSGCANAADGEQCGSLPRSDFKVLCAGSVEEALRLGLDFPAPIHLLLADVILPGKMLGTEVAAKLKEARPEMRVILMSGKPDGQLAVLHGSWVFLEKPFAGAQLLSRVRSVLESRATANG